MPSIASHGQKYLFVPLPTSIILSLWCGGKVKDCSWLRENSGLPVHSITNFCLFTRRTNTIQASYTIQSNNTKIQKQEYPRSSVLYMGLCMCVSRRKLEAGGCWGRIVTVIVRERLGKHTTGNSELIPLKIGSIIEALTFCYCIKPEITTPYFFLLCS